MSVSTFCKWAIDSKDPGSHRRCPGLHCGCDCHAEPATPTSTKPAPVEPQSVISTFCAYGQREHTSHDDPATHGRCAKTGQPCACECHADSASPNTEEGEPDVTLEELREHQALATNGDAPPEVADDGLVQCPECDRRVKARGLGVHRARAHDVAGKSVGAVRRAGEKKSTPRKVAPEAEAKVADALHDVAKTVDTEAAGLVLYLEDSERDVLDSLAFLHQQTAYDYVGGLITDYLAEHADDDDVKLLVTIRRARNEELAAIAGAATA